MSAGVDEDGGWAADKREFVADSRDDDADERDLAADRREALANAREAAADLREAELRKREDLLKLRARLELPVEGDQQLLAELLVSAREAAGGARVASARSRDEAKSRRDVATQRRVSRPTLLALVFSSIADQLYDANTYDEVLTRIAEAAVATIRGGDLASVTVRGRGGPRTAASTSQGASDVDQEQYEAEEGPCLDALSTALVDVAAFPDERWPLLGARPVEHGVESSASYHLNLGECSSAGPGTGSLNIYSGAPGAFDATALEAGAILAAYASLAARVVGERTTLERLGQDLQKALLSRDVIGQAKGILMERLRVTPEEAFEILKRSSQRLSVKLREVAVRLTETGAVDPHDMSKTPRPRPSR